MNTNTIFKSLIVIAGFLLFAALSFAWIFVPDPFPALDELQAIVNAGGGIVGAGITAFSLCKGAFSSPASVTVR